MNTDCARNLHAKETEHGKQEVLLLLCAGKKVGKREIRARSFFFKLTRSVYSVQLLKI